MLPTTNPVGGHQGARKSRIIRWGIVSGCVLLIFVGLGIGIYLAYDAAAKRGHEAEGSLKKVTELLPRGGATPPLKQIQEFLVKYKKWLDTHRNGKLPMTAAHNNRITEKREAIDKRLLAGVTAEVVQAIESNDVDRLKNARGVAVDIGNVALDEANTDTDKLLLRIDTAMRSMESPSPKPRTGKVPQAAST